MFLSRFLAARRFLAPILSLPVLVVWGCISDPGDPSELGPLAQARAAWLDWDYTTARKLAESISRQDADWAEAQLLLGQIARQLDHPQEALKYYASIPRDGSSTAVSAIRYSGHIEEARGHISKAVKLYEEVLKHEPDDTLTRTSIARLYADTGQRVLADRHAMQLLKRGKINFTQLVMMTDFERKPKENWFLKECEQKSPDDPMVNLGLAIEDLEESDVEKARRRLQHAVSLEPELAAAQALLGELLLDEGDAALKEWYGRLPESVHDHPGIRFVCGLWAVRLNQPKVAARCFWETVREVPGHQRATYQLGQVLAPLDEQASTAFSQRAMKLYELRETFSVSLNTSGGNGPAMQRVLQILLDSGREWEVWSWMWIAQATYKERVWQREMSAKVSEYPKAGAPRVRESLDLTKIYDLSGYPKFEPPAAVPSPDRSKRARLSEARIRFADQTEQLGIEFTYHQGRVGGTDGVRIFESTGGGVGVIDYDGDARPDLVFTQGEDWPLDAERPAPSGRYSDRIYRNTGSTFQDVTAMAGLPADDAYGQGCSCGDFNNDGFADLYIANIGTNQLLLNNGDGTFTDVTDELNLQTAAWTSSCLIADLNGDGNPDLFDVNYLEGLSVFRIICNENNCSPEAFTGAPDHLYLSRGDGTVRFVGSNEPEPEGKGLGLVAFRAQDERLLSLFIANDHAANFFLKNTGEGPEGPQFDEIGYLSGLAVNKDGKETACMGVANEDLDGDGQIDLFVTNYKGEANTLYLQRPGGLFLDATVGTGLLGPGLPYVAWGTQFLDADNDGTMDLVVANGHVADFRVEGVEYAMPMHFFRNLGGVQFQELPAELVGPFFGRKILGRSVALLDWNRDGRVDFALSCIDAPSALVTNETENAGNAIAIRLHAVTTARDAIGTIVDVTTDTGTVRKQLTGGDGYQATNERILRFGLGDQQAVKSIQIEWPGGTLQTVENVPANTVLDVVEGQRHLSTPVQP